MFNPLKVLNSLSASRPGTVTYLPEPAPKTTTSDVASEVEIDAQPSRSAQILTMPSRQSGSITARQLKEPTGPEVVTRATEAKVEELTAKYQPIVEKQVASLFPGLKQARQDLVASVTQVLVDRDLA